MTWTAQRVRDELPEVWVQTESGNITRGRVLGRLLDFATVHTPSDNRRFEYAWETIAHALTNGKPLKI